MSATTTTTTTGQVQPPVCVPTPGGVPALDDARVARLAFFGIEITPIIPLGANVKGVDFKKKDLPEEARELLEKEMATRGELNEGIEMTCSVI